MRSTVVYFSQTGNTEKVAYAIYEKLQSAGYNATPLLFEDTADFPEAIDGADILGVGFPTFFGHPPRFFEEFLQALPEVKGTSAFVFTTYGGATAGDSLYDAAQILAGKGYRLLGGLKVEGSDNYPQGVALEINKGRPNEADLSVAGEFADLIIRAHKSGKVIEPDRLASQTPFFIENRSKPRDAFLEKMRKEVEGKVLFNKEQCLFCETCKKTCPTRSITTGEGFPEFSWKCIGGMQCFQCARVCPGKALTVQYPGSLEDYRKFRALSADRPEEKKRNYIVG